MITEKTYRQITAKQWEGMKVESLVKLKNSLAELPAGTVFEIRGKGGGFSLKSEPCRYCGIRMFITRVRPTDLKLLEAK